MILTLVYRNEALNRPIANKLSELYVAEGKAAPRIEEWLKDGLDLSTMAGDTLTLLDLSGDGYFQKYCCGEVFATELLNMGLPPSVTTIEVIVSDVLKGQSISTFASELAYNLNIASKGKNKAIVEVYYDLNYEITLIEPPSANSEKWRIHGICRLGEKMPRDVVLTMDKLLPLTAGKSPLWEGTDIRDALKKFYPDTGCRYSFEVKPVLVKVEQKGEKETQSKPDSMPISTTLFSAFYHGNNKKRNSDSLTPEKSIDDEFKTVELKEENSPKKLRITSVQTSTKSLIDISAEEKTNGGNNYSPRPR